MRKGFTGTRERLCAHHDAYIHKNFTLKSEHGWRNAIFQLKGRKPCSARGASGKGQRHHLPAWFINADCCRSAARRFASRRNGYPAEPRPSQWFKDQAKSSSNPSSPAVARRLPDNARFECRAPRRFASRRNRVASRTSAISVVQEPGKIIF